MLRLSRGQTILATLGVLFACRGCACTCFRYPPHESEGCGKLPSYPTGSSSTNTGAYGSGAAGSGAAGAGGASNEPVWQGYIEVCDGHEDEDLDGLVDEDCPPSLWVGLFPPGGGADLTSGGITAQVEADVGRALPVVQTYHATQAAGVAAIGPDLAAILGHGAVPHLNLEPSGYGAAQYLAGDTDPGLAADLDAAAQAIASALAGDPGARMLLTFGAEMNGAWTDWGCLPPSSYIALYRAAHARIQAALVALGVDARRVRFVYGPNGTSSPGCGSAIDYYPGHDAVDYLGLSAYRSGTASVADAVVTPAHALLSGLGYDATWARGRVIVLQTGTRDEPNDDSAAWVGALFPALLADGAFRGAIYFNDADWALLTDPGGGPVPREGYDAFVAALAALPRADGGLEGTFEPFFWDVSASDAHYPEIQSLRAAGFTSGCALAPPTFCPDAPLTRRDAAVLLGRAFYIAPDTTSLPLFDDVPASDPAYGFVEALGVGGLLPGCTFASFCPDDAIARIDLANAIGWLVGTPLGASPFADYATPAGGTALGALAGAGVIEPCAPNAFCPNDGARRTDGAAWIARGSYVLPAAPL